MTVITFQGCLNMACAFALCNHIVMTATTYTNDFIVIHCVVSDGCPGCWPNLMAGITGICAVDMIDGLATGNHIVMATHTGTNDMGVIHSCVRYGYPGCGSWLMTGITGIRAIDVAGRFSGRRCSVVTTETGAYNFIMIYSIRRHRRPRCREYRMAGIAGVGGINM